MAGDIALDKHLDPGAVRRMPAKGMPGVSAQTSTLESARAMASRSVSASRKASTRDGANSHTSRKSSLCHSGEGMASTRGQA